MYAAVVVTPPPSGAASPSTLGRERHAVTESPSKRLHHQQTEQAKCPWLHFQDVGPLQQSEGPIPTINVTAVSVNCTKPIPNQTPMHLGRCHSCASQRHPDTMHNSCPDWSVSHSVFPMSLRVLVCTCGRTILRKIASHQLIQNSYPCFGVRTAVSFSTVVRAWAQTARGFFYVGFSTKGRRSPAPQEALQERQIWQLIDALYFPLRFLCNPLHQMAHIYA